MEVSSIFKASQRSEVSPDGKHIATLNGSLLEIRRISNLEVVRTIIIPFPAKSRFLCMRWSPIVKGVGSSDRILVSDEDVARVWDLQDPDWSATIDNSTAGMTKIANVEFGMDDTEVLVFSSFCTKVTVWSLWTGQSVELKDPKFSNRGFGRNRTGRRGVFTLLTRPATQDILTFYVPGSYQPLKNLLLPTIDAQGLKWSPDGRWLAVWDTPSTGYKVYIYTADGILFRTYNGDYFDDSLHGLGVKRIEWSPNGDFLAVAGYQKPVALLTTRTFSPAVYLSHPNSIKHTSAQIWQEQVTATSRSYAAVTPPISPPSLQAQSSSADNALKQGPSIVAFSSDGSFLATRDDDMPTVAWIWDLSQQKPCAILLQHAVIKRLLWHPTNPDVLLMQCIQGESILYSWNVNEGKPSILDVSPLSFSGKAEASWVPKQAHRKPIVLYGDANGFAFAYPEGLDEFGSPVLEAKSKSMDFEVSEVSSEDDSLYEILSGKQSTIDDEQIISPPTAEFEHLTTEDTFQYRNGVGVY